MNLFKNYLLKFLSRLMLISLMISFSVLQNGAFAAVGPSIYQRAKSAALGLTEKAKAKIDSAKAKMSASKAASKRAQASKLENQAFDKRVKAAKHNKESELEASRLADLSKERNDYSTKQRSGTADDNRLEEIHKVEGFQRQINSVKKRALIADKSRAENIEKAKALENKAARLRGTDTPGTLEEDSRNALAAASKARKERDVAALNLKNHQQEVEQAKAGLRYDPSDRDGNTKRLVKLNAKVLKDQARYDAAHAEVKKQISVAGNAKAALSKLNDNSSNQTSSSSPVVPSNGNAIDSNSLNPAVP